MKSNANALRIFTCSVYPDLTRVWYRVLRRSFLIAVQALRPSRFRAPKSRRVPNWEHGRKIDVAMQIPAGPDPVLIVDDDAFLLSRSILDDGLEALDREEQTARYRLYCRDWWQIPAAGSPHVPMGSYALLVKPGIIRAEALSFCAVRTSDPAIRNGSGYSDTADFCQKQLLERSYAIRYAPESDRQEIPTFFGTSGGFLTFARRSILGRGLVHRRGWHRTDMARIADRYSFQRGCSVTAVIDLHRRLLLHEPSFADWHKEPELRSYAPASDTRKELPSAADRIFEIRDRVASTSPMATPAEAH